MTQEIPCSTEVVSAEEVQAALDRMAREVTARLAGSRPLVITVMNGGQVFAGQLLPRLPFALDCSYVHVRRYGRETSGGELVWIAGPHDSVTGRTVLLLDDILDEGRTLAAIRERLVELGSREVLLAAFAVKDRRTPAEVEADFIGVRVPNRFVFGFGMDLGGLWRNLPSIRALAETAD
jgi:hypoxanthine phosphoribosyltransferase